MSIQDDIFDLETVLDGKPEAEAFSRVLDHVALLERKVERSDRLLVDLEKGTKAVRVLFNLAKD